MKHHHHHSQIGIAFLLNFFFTIIELIGAYFTNSIAIYSNALHDLGDSLSLGFGYLMERLSQNRKKRDQFTYGYQRFSLLAALVNGLILVGGSIFILTEAISRLMHPEPSLAAGMFWLAVLGLIINGLAVLRLKGGTTLNARMVRWHLIEDVLSWGAILIVSIAIWFLELHFLDPVLSVLITLFILWNVSKHLYETSMLFLQGKPATIDIQKIKDTILQVKSVRKIHDMHFWSLDGEHHVLTAHVVLSKGASAKEQFTAKCCIKRLISEFATIHTTLEIETEDEECDITTVC